MNCSYSRSNQIDSALSKTHKSWFSNIASLFRTKTIDGTEFDSLEEALISADVGVNTTQVLLERVKAVLLDRPDAGPDAAMSALNQEMVNLIGKGDSNLSSMLSGKSAKPKPMVVLVVGVNGSGKTTSIAKLANYFQSQGAKVLLGAADTFRAAAIDQLQAWGRLLSIEVVSHKPGGDPAAVAFDAVQAGHSRGYDVVIIDIAGRLHTEHNLMNELKKIYRVIQRLDNSAPHLTLLVLDATTGQNGLIQARVFTEAVQCNGTLLAKLDGTSKGGVVLAIQKELGLPVLFIGTGEGVNDLSPFEPELFVNALLKPSSKEVRAERSGHNVL